MRLRDMPTTERSAVVSASPEQVWELVTDISLPTRFAGELQTVNWVDGYDHVELGAKFQGHNASEHLGEWTTNCEVVDFEPGARWMYAVRTDSADPMTWWGFEVEPSSAGTIVRQFARVGPGESGLHMVLKNAPEKEARVISYRMGEWEAAMEANLAGIAALIGS